MAAVARPASPNEVVHLRRSRPSSVGRDGLLSSDLAMVSPGESRCALQKQRRHPVLATRPCGAAIHAARCSSTHETTKGPPTGGEWPTGVKSNKPAPGVQDDGHSSRPCPSPSCLGGGRRAANMSSTMGSGVELDFVLIRLAPKDTTGGSQTSSSALPVVAASSFWELNG